MEVGSGNGEMATGRPKILLSTGTFFPAYRTGGPARSVTNLVKTFRDAFDFSVITLSTDMGVPMDVPLDQWTEVDGVPVYYISPQKWSVRRMEELIGEREFDILYINGFTDSWYSITPIWLRWRGRIPYKPTILTIRGDLGAGALRSGGWLKRVKKWSYRTLSRGVGMYRDVLFQVTSHEEDSGVRRFFPRNRTLLAPNLSDPTMPEPRDHRKESGTLRLVYLARIHEIKRTDWALERIAELHGEVRFDLYGPIEGKEYWAHCQELILAMPANVTVEYHGPLPHERMAEVFVDGDFFILPTQSENFGHSIIEAMKYSCPVVISDRTCWRHLAGVSAGWDLPMADADAWNGTLQRCVDMGPEEYEGFAMGAWRYAKEHVNTPETVEQSRRMFLDALEDRLKEGVQDG